VSTFSLALAPVPSSYVPTLRSVHMGEQMCNHMHYNGRIYVASMKLITVWFCSHLGACDFHWLNKILYPYNRLYSLILMPWDWRWHFKGITVAEGLTLALCYQMHFSEYDQSVKPNTTLISEWRALWRLKVLLLFPYFLQTQLPYWSHVCQIWSISSNMLFQRGPSPLPQLSCFQLGSQDCFGAANNETEWRDFQACIS